MADVIFDNQAIPGIPAAGKTVAFVHSGTKQIITRDDAGRFASLSGSIRNRNTADVVASAADTYLTGSAIAIPTGLLLQVGTTFRWVFGMTKTAAGTGAPVWLVRVGTAGTTADAAQLAFIGPVQTAAVDTGKVVIHAILRNVGAAGVLAGILTMTHHGITTGFANIACPTIQNTSAGFDTTVANTIIGVSVNPGAAGVWTHQVVSAECLGI